jgi:hypothetical protein
MKIRMISAPLLALVVGLALLVPAPAFGQHTRLIFGDDQGIYVPADDHQLIRVTIGNSHLPAPAADSRTVQSFYIEFDRPVDSATQETTIEPDESFTYTLDPREVGVLVDPRTGLRHVRVSFRFKVEVLEGQPAPRPALTIEILNRKTGTLDSFHAFPGFMGGVVVAS